VVDLKKEIIRSLKSRAEDELVAQNPVAVLKTADIEMLFDTIVSIVYLYTRPKKGHNRNSIYLTEVISALGHGVRSKLKLKRNSSAAAKTGAFILYTFEMLGMLRVVLGGGDNGHGQYLIQVTNDDAISKLWDSLPITGVEKLPHESPPAKWVSTRHITGQSMVKTGNRGVLDKINATDHPMIFDCLNKAQQVGWTVNKDIYDLHLWALRNKVEAFNDIWNQQSPEARITKTREARAIGDIAKRFLGKTFYHLYSYDFRGRKYPSTTYLHEQGSDLARGLLLRADKKEIGKDGFFWLCVSIASNWAGDSGRADGAKTDKIPLHERYLWTIDNEEILLSYAESPKVNQGWMKADKPWQFLAACNELLKLRLWQMHNDKGLDDYEYSSHLECYIDGSNNGSQHLAALTRDETTAPLVNLVPLDLPGDLYRYVGDHVWKRIGDIVDAMPHETIVACDKFIDDLIGYKKKIYDAPQKSELRKALVDEIRAFKDRNEEIAKLAAPVFWIRFTDSKQKRKVVKR
jgi:hypothetical protein